MNWQTFGLLVIVFVIDWVSSDIFSTDQLYGSAVTTRTLFESYNSGNNAKTLLLTDQTVANDGHLIGFKFYHHESVPTSVSNSKVYISIWRLVSGSSYQLVQGLDPLSSTTYDESGAVTTQAGVRIAYLTNPAIVASGDIIGISISDSTSPIAYAEPGTSCTYKESIDASGTWPPATATFSDTSMNCREYSLQAVVDTTYTGIRYSYCQFILAETSDAFQSISTTVYDTNNNKVEYSNNLDLCWLVRGPLENEGIKFETQFFDVESGYDILKISSYNGSVYQEYQFSGTVGPDFSTASPSAKVTFLTDGTVTLLGFELYFGYGTSGLSSPDSSSSSDGTNVGLIVGLTILGIAVIVIIFVILCYYFKWFCFKEQKQVQPSRPTSRQAWSAYPLETRQSSTPPPASYHAPLQSDGHVGPAAGEDYGGTLPPVNPTAGYTYLQKDATSAGPFGFNKSSSRTTLTNVQVEEVREPPAPVLPPLVSEQTYGGDLITFGLKSSASGTSLSKRGKLEPVAEHSSHA